MSLVNKNLRNNIFKQVYLSKIMKCKLLNNPLDLTTNYRKIKRQGTMLKNHHQDAMSKTQPVTILGYMTYFFHQKKLERTESREIYRLKGN